ncbi:MAG TPA: DUF2520 domain-containing protein [Actinobacteria bacterium]|nr:DUF2520 domain-containing protein [Actinomycetota bacterium]
MTGTEDGLKLKSSVGQKIFLVSGVKMRKKVSIIGAGVVGTAIGHILKKKGYEIVAFASRSKSSFDRVRVYTDIFVTTDVVKAASLADLVFITTQDDQIERVCEKIASGNGFKPGQIVFHMSGTLSIEALKSAKEAGASIASAHPMQSFADVDLAIEQLSGTYFGVTADKKIRPQVFKLVEDLGGISIMVKDEDKPLYHAAACAASNYLVAILRFAQEIYSSMDIPHDVGLKAMWPLIQGTLKNIEWKGTSQALTGPIARGDTGTIEKHLLALKLKLPGALDLYKKMGAYAVDVALEKGSIDMGRANELRRLLEEE